MLPVAGSTRLAATRVVPRHLAFVDRRAIAVRAAPATTTQQADPWLKVVEAEKKGEVVEVVVKSFNKGGLVCNLGELRAFVPYNQLAADTLKKGHAGDMSFLLGRKLRARVVSVDLQSARREIVLSQKKAVLGEALKGLAVGDEVSGVVAGVEEYGAFVTLDAPAGVSGLVHKSELSWEKFTRVDDVVKKGQRVRVKVHDVDASKCRLNLSLKRMTPDPLSQGLDNAEWGPTGAVPPAIQSLVDRLKGAAGVTDVMYTRQANDPHHVSQELQVFMSKAGPGSGARDGFLVVARLGSTLQELQVSSTLARDEFKTVLQSIK